MTKSQENAIARFRRKFDHDMESMAKYGAVLKFEVSGTEHGTAWIRAQINLEGLNEGNLLRCLTSMDDWFVHVGKNGALVAHRYPKSCNQFKGRRPVYGITYK